MNPEGRVPVDVELDAETAAAVEAVRDKIEAETGLRFTFEEAVQLLLDHAARQLPDDPEEAVEVLAERLDLAEANGGEGGE